VSSHTEIDSEHPLFVVLRNGLMWHRTGSREYRQIVADGEIRPNDGRVNRWSRPYACQELGGISLFDFTTECEERVLREAIKWRQFLGDGRPVTVLLGFKSSMLPGQLVRYPANKKGTKGNVIPWVEVCHRGPIPVTAITSYVVVCPVNYSLFWKLSTLDIAALAKIEKEFAEEIRREENAQARAMAPLTTLKDSRQFVARLEQAKRAVEASKRSRI
jgi:hypothetical protein